MVVQTHRVFPGRAAGLPQQGRVVGYGRRERPEGGESEFYVELRKPSGESVVYEGEGVRVAAEAAGVDVGFTVTIEADVGVAPRIVRSHFN